MNKTLISLVATAAVAGIAILGGFAFAVENAGKVLLSEETVSGNKQAAEGVSVKFGIDSGKGLYWINRYSFSAEKTESSLRRGKMPGSPKADPYRIISFNNTSPGEDGMYYSLEFSFKLGSKIYTSDDSKLYSDINEFFRIPVPFEGDSYSFNPAIILQEENSLDGIIRNHPDLEKGVMKNRLLFAAQSRTQQGNTVDFSGVKGGYGIYELPIETVLEGTITGYKKRSWLIPNPKPLTNRVSMVYPLDETVETVDLTMSADHRYLALFSKTDGFITAEIIDADLWRSVGTFRLFTASGRLTYAWGEDGTLAAANHCGYVAIITKSANEQEPYELFFAGKVGEGLDNEIFDGDSEYHRHVTKGCCSVNDARLEPAHESGRVVMVQSLMSDDRKRVSGVECAVFDNNGVLYMGRLRSSIVGVGEGKGLKGGENSVSFDR